MNRSVLFFILKAIASCAIIAVIAFSIDIDSTLARIGEVSTLAVCLALLLGQVQIVLVALRWIAILRAIGADLPFVPSVRVTYIGSFFNQTLPSSMGGDIYRMYLAYKFGIPLARSITSVLLERVLTVIGLLLLILFGLPSLLRDPQAADVETALPFVGLLSVGALAGVIGLMAFNRFSGRWTRFRIVRALNELSGDMSLLLTPPRRILAPLGIMLVSLFNLMAMMWVLSRGLGMDLSPGVVFVLFPLILLASAVPISVGGWGVREGAAVAALGLVGVPAEPAFALSVLFGLMGVVGSLPGGLIWLLSGDTRRPSLDKAEAAAKPDAPEPASR